MRNPYPWWHKICQTWSLLVHKICQTWSLHGVLLAQNLGPNPYPYWHKFDVKNPTLSGTLLENTILCGTEIGQNGTLAILAYTLPSMRVPPPPWVVII